MAEILDFKCPSCNAPINFDSAGQRMKCPYCDSEFDVEALQGKDEVLNSQPADEFNWQMQSDGSDSTMDDSDMAVFVCKSCGGEIVSEETTAATSCPYCGNPVVLSGRLSGDLKPDYVIPFKLDKKSAKLNLKNYVSKKRFAPNLFKSENKIEKVTGIYVPFWLFDSDIDASCSYTATRVRTWSDKNYNYTETSFYDVFRQGSMSFSNIPVDGSSKMPDDLMESIEPFNFGEAQQFQTAYLAGYLADRYDVTMQDSIGRANERVKQSAEDSLRQTVNGYATVTANSTSVQIKKGNAKYAMYPVWLLNTDYKGEKFTFAMNGQTGKIVGNVPASSAKLAGLFAALTGGISVVVFLLGNLLGWF